MREACEGCVSSAKHRSDSAARSTPTRSIAKGHAQKNRFIISNSIYTTIFHVVATCLIT
ncbi:MAG: hypothetical protein NZ455_03390 [Bacteroidia bacterium]|nr:hypothetical protein [Bacteroidia bacterium]MDW8348114.1 hypothetical protein [Bacteroidia bacterium]